MSSPTPHFTHPFRSDRLIYRAIEPSDPEDEAFFHAMQQDASIYVNSNTCIPKPQTKKHTQEYMKALNDSLCAAVICLPAEKEEEKPIPIGAIHLQKSGDGTMHHRVSDIAVEIIPKYQRKGYGGEAIHWILEWAFERAGIHRVGIRCFAYNEGARRLYERLGFKPEGISREMLWYQNRWWDDVQFGMLDREWAEIKAKKKAKNNIELPDHKANA